MSIEPQFHPVTALGLPDYSAASLSNDETRMVYIHGELRMRELHNDLVRDGLGVEEQAKTMFALRYALRTWTRTLMSDTAMAEWLEANERSAAATDRGANATRCGVRAFRCQTGAQPTFDQLVALHEGRGLTGDAVYMGTADARVIRLSVTVGVEERLRRSCCVMHALHRTCGARDGRVASQRLGPSPRPRELDELRGGHVLGVDLNATTAACVLDSSGNAVAEPITIQFDTTGLRATRRDGRVRARLPHSRPRHNTPARVV